ncbi:C40 family peptidase [Indiicoccus explosivorum]|uniref:C40 family peptidase n=1 Tax=Indiicoccus explosivorum TaxID=1917864 RepID=UPI00138FD3CA|nr:C40 family peptidase [Indiicoccus explosivorum]
MKKSLLLVSALSGTLVFGTAVAVDGQPASEVPGFSGKEVAFEALPAAPEVKGVSTAQPSADILNVADQYLGANYLLGASTSRTDAFDCSSFSKRVFSELGIELPRHSAAQAELGEKVPMKDLQKGDLVYFATSETGGVSHVGIYAGDGEMISAQNGGVKYAPIDEGYWNEHFLFAKRVLS